MFLCSCRFLWILPSNNQERMMLLCCTLKLLVHRDTLTLHKSRVLESEVNLGHRKKVRKKIPFQWLLKWNECRTNAACRCVFVPVDWEILNLPVKVDIARRKILLQSLASSLVTLYQKINCVSPSIFGRNNVFGSCWSIVQCYALKCSLWRRQPGTCPALDESTFGSDAHAMLNFNLPELVSFTLERSIYVPALCTTLCSPCRPCKLKKRKF